MPSLFATPSLGPTGLAVGLAPWIGRRYRGLGPGFAPWTPREVPLGPPLAAASAHGRAADSAMCMTPAAKLTGAPERCIHLPARSSLVAGAQTPLGRASTAHGRGGAPAGSDRDRTASAARTRRRPPTGLAPSAPRRVVRAEWPARQPQRLAATSTIDSVAAAAAPAQPDHRRDTSARAMASIVAAGWTLSMKSWRAAQRTANAIRAVLSSRLTVTVATPALRAVSRPAAVTITTRGLLLRYRSLAFPRSMKESSSRTAVTMFCVR